VNDNVIKIIGGRKEIFEIADDEQLIGCEFENNGEVFVGLTWIKIKVR
jgi:hypothetical protein